MSNSLLNNKYLNKLDVNRLQVNQLKANEVLPKIDSETNSYLYSAILNNVEFKKIENGDYNAELIINLTNQKEVIQFTDRPFTQSSKITIQQFVQLFLLREPDSFKEIPPNVVLIFNNIQKSYTMSLANFFAKENKVIYNLKLLTGEEHTQENFTGTINMFVDNMQNSGQIASTGVYVGIPPGSLIDNYYTAKYNGAVRGFFNIATAKNIGNDVYKLYNEYGFNFAIWKITSQNAYFAIPNIISSTFYVSGSANSDSYGNGIFGDLKETDLPNEYVFG